MDRKKFYRQQTRQQTTGKPDRGWEVINFTAPAIPGEVKRIEIVEYEDGTATAHVSIANEVAYYKVDLGNPSYHFPVSQVESLLDDGMEMVRMAKNVSRAGNAYAVREYRRRESGATLSPGEAESLKTIPF